MPLRPVLTFARKIRTRLVIGQLRMGSNGASYAVYITHIGVLRRLSLINSLIGIDPSHHLRFNMVLWTLIAQVAAWVFDAVYDARVRKYVTRTFA